MAGRGAGVTPRPAAVVAGLCVCACLAAAGPRATGDADRAEGRPAGHASHAGKAAHGVKVVTAAASVGEQTAVPMLVRGESAPLEWPLDLTMSPVDCRTNKCIALTFDDGPATTTARLLDTLAANGARATFFLVGRNVERFPELAAREAAQGHELANHTYSHPNLPRSSTAKITRELRRTRDAIRRATGRTPALMRPPYGATGEEVAAITRRLKLAQVLWSLDPFDWQVQDAEKVEREVVSEARNGSIVLLHDVHPTTVDAVPGIIERLSAKGYSFVTVSEIFGRPLVPGKVYSAR